MAINYGSNSVTTTNKITSGAIDITDGYNTLYYYSGGDGYWDTVANWYLDYDHTISAGRIPTVNDVVVILNGLTSASTTVVAKEIIVRDSGYLGVSTDIYSDVKFFDSTYISAGSITGNATFYNSSYTNTAGSSSSPVVVGNAVFKNTSYIGYNGTSYFGLSVTFDDDSHPHSSGSLVCQQININGSDPCVGSYYGNVDVTSGYGISIGSSTFAVYDGNLTIYKNNIINGSSVQVTNGSLILKDNSIIGSNNSVSFYGLCKLVLDNTGSSYYASSVSIGSGSYGNYNASLTIIVNGYPSTTYGWMFGGGSNNIACDKLIFNGNSFYYGTNNLSIGRAIIFNDDSYWHSSAANNGSLIQQVIFNDNSYNDGTLDCDTAIFNDYSYNDYIIDDNSGYGNAIFNDYSQNNSSCTVGGRAIFKGFSQNYGTITTEAWFDDFSKHNTGGYVGGAIYYLGSLSANGGSGNSEYYQNWD